MLVAARANGAPGLRRLHAGFRRRHPELSVLRNRAQEKRLAGDSGQAFKIRERGAAPAR